MAKETTDTKDAASEKLPSFKDLAAKDDKLSHEEIARDIILAISHELHVRVGIGPIWRQLNAVRKKEIIDAWTLKTIAILDNN